MVTLEQCFEALSRAVGIGIATGVIIDLLAYGIMKALGLLNIKI